MKKRLALLILLAMAAPPALTPALAETRVGVSMALFDDNFLTTLRQAIGDHAKSKPGVQVQFQDAQGDVGKQIS